MATIEWVEAGRVSYRGLIRLAGKPYRVATIGPDVSPYPTNYVLQLEVPGFTKPVRVKTLEEAQSGAQQRLDSFVTLIGRAP